MNKNDTAYLIGLKDEPLSQQSVFGDAPQNWKNYKLNKLGHSQEYILILTSEVTSTTTSVLICILENGKAVPKYIEFYFIL